MGGCNLCARIDLVVFDIFFLRHKLIFYILAFIYRHKLYISILEGFYDDGLHFIDCFYDDGLHFIKY